MKKPEFTEEQQDYLASIIDHWYLHWKHGIVEDRIPHRLGYAKEQLKSLIYWPENTKDYLELAFRHGMYRQALEIMERHPELKQEQEHDHDSE